MSLQHVSAYGHILDAGQVLELEHLLRLVARQPQARIVTEIIHFKTRKQHAPSVIAADALGVFQNASVYF